MASLVGSLRRWSCSPGGPWLPRRPRLPDSRRLRKPKPPWVTSDASNIHGRATNTRQREKQEKQRRLERPRGPWMRSPSCRPRPWEPGRSPLGLPSPRFRRGGSSHRGPGAGSPPLAASGLALRRTPIPPGSSCWRGFGEVTPRARRPGIPLLGRRCLRLLPLSLPLGRPRARRSRLRGPLSLHRLAPRWPRLPRLPSSLRRALPRRRPEVGCACCASPGGTPRWTGAAGGGLRPSGPCPLGGARSCVGKAIGGRAARSRYAPASAERSRYASEIFEPAPQKGAAAARAAWPSGQLSRLGRGTALCSCRPTEPRGAARKPGLCFILKHEMATPGVRTHGRQRTASREEAHHCRTAPWNPADDSAQRRWHAAWRHVGG